ncbi:hypothetical protein [Neisseria sp.]
MAKALAYLIPTTSSASLLNSYGENTASASPKEGQSGKKFFVIGSNNRVWASNAMVLGNNVAIYGIVRRLENCENAVVLGNSNDGASTMRKVNSANVNGMGYSGFKGNLFR